MTLSDYLTAAGLTDLQFAAQVSTSNVTINRLRNGKMSPSLRLAAAIERATNGLVKAIDFSPPQPVVPSSGATFAAALLAVGSSDDAVDEKLQPLDHVGEVLGRPLDGRGVADRAGEHQSDKGAALADAILRVHGAVLHDGSVGHENSPADESVATVAPNAEAAQ